MNTQDLINSLYTIDLTNSSQAVKDLYLYLQEMFKDFEFEGDLDQLTQLLITHISNVSNPHVVTAEQVGIDASLVGVTATQLVASVTTLATQNQTDIADHLANVSNPHEVTYQQVGFHEVTMTDPADPTGATQTLGLEITLSDGSTLSLISVGDDLVTINTTLASLQSQITDNLNNLQTQITTNATNIATNTTDIGTNTTNITNNTQSIAQNETNITANTTAITTIENAIFNAGTTTYNVDPTLQNITALDLPISTATQTAITTTNDNLNNHVINTNNPHGVTATQIGIDSSLVGVTADNLPTTSAVQTQFDSILATQSTHTTQIGQNTSNITTNISNIRQLQDLVAALENVITQFPTMGISEPYATTGDVPTPISSSMFYLIGSAVPYDVYIYLSSQWFKIGSFDGSSGQFATQLDLTNVRSELLALIQTNTQDIANIMAGGAENPELGTHLNDHSNPHQVTKAQVGLGNVDDTTDLDKPISNATQTALNNVNLALTTHTSSTANPHGVTKAQVGLGNVANVDTTNASNISSGTLPMARINGGFTATLSGANNLNNVITPGLYIINMGTYTAGNNFPIDEQPTWIPRTAMAGTLLVTSSILTGITPTTGRVMQTFITREVSTRNNPIIFSRYIENVGATPQVWSKWNMVAGFWSVTCTATVNLNEMVMGHTYNLFLNGGITGLPWGNVGDYATTVANPTNIIVSNNPTNNDGSGMQRIEHITNQGSHSYPSAIPLPYLATRRRFSNGTWSQWAVPPTIQASRSGLIDIDSIQSLPNITNNVVNLQWLEVQQVTFTAPSGTVFTLSNWWNIEYKTRGSLVVGGVSTSYVKITKSQTTNSIALSNNSPGIGIVLSYSSGSTIPRAISIVGSRSFRSGTTSFLGRSFHFNGNVSANTWTMNGITNNTTGVAIAAGTYTLPATLFPRAEFSTAPIGTVRFYNASGALVGSDVIMSNSNGTVTVTIPSTSATSSTTIEIVSMYTVASETIVPFLS